MPTQFLHRGSMVWLQCGKYPNPKVLLDARLIDGRLVATLGSQSSARKINRKAILEVNVPKACETILMSEAPMALRLQSNLLYGVSRVYSQQCGYVLGDAQHVHNLLRGLFKASAAAQLDPQAGRARPEQLLLSDDPAFIPDFILPRIDADLSIDIDFSSLDVPSWPPSGSVLSPRSQERLGTSSDPDARSPPNLVIPSSSSDVGADYGGFTLPGDERSSALRHDRMHLGEAIPEEDEDAFLPDFSFEFDSEGNMREIPLDSESAQILPQVDQQQVEVEADASAQVRAEHQEGRVPIGLRDPLDDDFELYMEGDYDLPEAEPFDQRPVPPAPSPPRIHSHSTELRRDENLSDSEQAPVGRPAKARRLIIFDEAIELQQSEILGWKTTYSNRMNVTRRNKRWHRAQALSKRNAAFWTFQSGLGGVGRGIGVLQMPGPLRMFSGDELRASLNVTPGTPRDRKRGRPRREADAEREDGRNVRQRVVDDGEDNIGRGDDLALQYQDDEEIEIGREAAAELRDLSSGMPWNTLVSIQGSRLESDARGRSMMPGSITGHHSSVGGHSSLPSLAGRLASASPHAHHRARAQAQRRNSPAALTGGPHDEGSLPPPASHDDDGQRIDSDQLGPWASGEVQTAEGTQVLREALDRESFNFLEFVKTNLDLANDPGQGQWQGVVDDDNIGEVSKAYIAFDEIIRPKEQSTIVAAQALHHVLSLASRNLLIVQQDEDYGEIRLLPK
ncbi:MAG: hypothetical protein M1825_002582 [Sarcosagium campestre]|nr:MAG: hypothetical protein M1825_002582 [Sarcosagium campestre]